MNVLVIYHGGCVDGFTAAWVAHQKYGDAAEYVEGWYGKEPPSVTGRDVIIVDFSYPRAVLEKMAAEAQSLLVLDHHKTAEADLTGLPYCTFDMNRSGAGLAWDELIGGVRPELVDYVEDRDLWRFKLLQSREINAVIGATEQNFEKWTALAERLSTGFFERTADIGQALVQSVDRYVVEMAKHAIVRTVAGEKVPVVNAPYINTSELVGKLAETAPFAVGWYQRADGLYAYSLRSRGAYDVSDLAKRFGGGGHAKAAGFTSNQTPAELFG